jgi:putative ABC transport system permease protein
MIRTRWYKVLLDLWNNRGRTMVVALAIAVGVYSVGVIVDVQQMLLREYGNDQAGALISTATLYTTPFDDDLAARISQIPGVAAAEGRHSVRVYVALPPPKGAIQFASTSTMRWANARI